MRAIIFTILLAIGIVPANWAAETTREYEPLVKKIYALYGQGDYSGTIATIDELLSRVGDWGIALYLKGRCYVKLQQFEKANIAFGKGLKTKVFPQESYYEYAQSLYTANELVEGKKFFNESIKRKIEVAHSYYYVGDIFQILKDYDNAEKSFNKILGLENADAEIKQAAAYRIAKISLERMLQKKEISKEAQEKEVNQFIIPKFKDAIEVSPKTNFAFEINREIKEIQEKYKLVYADGRPKKAKAYSLKISQIIDYDTNVTQTPDDSGSQMAVDSASLVSKSEILGKYSIDFSDALVMGPELKLTYDQYLSDTPEVYQNNSYSIGPSLRTQYKHKVSDKASSAIFDIDYNYFAKDYQQNKTLAYFSGTTTITLGEKISWFAIGQTTGKLKFKTFSGHTALLDSSTVSFNLTQFYTLPDKQMMLFLFNIDSTTASVESNSTTSYMLRVDYLGLPLGIFALKADFALATTMLDTGLQSAARGTELTLSPSAKISRVVFEKGDLFLSYEYSSKSSKQEDVYAYSKNVISMGMSYNF
ncbi:MAG: hypothetical protein A2504_16635 [Bdellovibrionales bacterium RIFOXYD12_FULL_39_22]|nr:MAG: hypothetical protein A2385_14490 [Bdellovibrionales bacterium RIFOXYB1_FULL_39_21]OFZ45000.1 MAG: hypothetical protein A2485_13915 [Bdellovibrionales bacterium RIFOXYC12_FULL_39_17]OFZ49438.1 MAG: hypothetical protein A2404_08400 [Bdellovibrionales bacterium RIFOXYC1_FULL_39_130]OFZ77177.1 MAG: hypothetical protein A2560_07925 [Bdellovibrionales bacterium RIFOXYD1_FULL_39_84]OFZ95622.1 MAG: hypothetical protein A2504_16635 [Bdellovibrionales bacterium RIFOXYD12_FULL_39_22]HLE11133.1 hy